MRDGAQFDRVDRWTDSGNVWQTIWANIKWRGNDVKATPAPKITYNSSIRHVQNMRCVFSFFALRMALK